MRVHRDKDAVEKCFDDLKNSLDMKRLRMHTSATVDGRLFVQFIALEYLTQYGGNHGHPSLPVG